MADETFEIGFEVSGDGAAKKSFEEVALQTLAAKEEAKKLATAYRDLKASTDPSEEAINEAALAMVNAQRKAQTLATELRQVARAQQTQATSARTTATTMVRAQASVTEAVTTGGRKWGELGGAIGNVGSVFASVSPRLGQVGSLMGAVGSASTALTGALGPVGVGIAAVTTAAGLLIPMLMSTDDEIDDVGESARQAAADLREMAEAIRESDEEQNRRAGLSGVRAVEEHLEDVERRARAAAQQLAAAETGLGNVGVDNENIERTVATHETARRAGQGGLVDGAQTREAVDAYIAARDALAEVTREREQYNEALRDARAAHDSEQSAQVRTAETIASANAQREREEAQRAEHHRRQQERERSGSAAARQRAAEEARVAQQGIDALQRLEDARKRLADERAEAERRYAEGTQDQLRALHNFWRDLDKETVDRVKANRGAMLDKEREAATQQAEKAKEGARALQEESQRVGAIQEGMWKNIAGTVTDAAGQMFSFIQAGGDLGSEAFLAMLDSFLEATAFEYSIKAIAEAANAVAAAARYDYAAAAQHGVAAGMAVAVAAATGIAGAAISVPSTSTGGGAPAPVQQGAGGGGGPTNITLQMFAPQAVFTEAERGTIFASGVREARRHLGPGAVRP